MGTTTTNSGGTTITGRRIRIHPNFNAREYSNDIALVYLSSSITYNDRIQPIALPTEDFTKPNYPATLTGWGMLSVSSYILKRLSRLSRNLNDFCILIYFQFPGTVSRNLQEITLTIMDQQDCLDSDSRISGSNICTIAPAGQGACRVSSTLLLIKAFLNFRRGAFLTHDYFQGDSGGPLVADGVQVGVVSWGSPCALGRPDVYARVWSYVDWIKQTSGI